MDSAPRTARARARIELTREIKEAARRHLADEGAAALSLRAVARELGMVSSAVYRYFPSRDDLLTALIVDAYDAVGEAAERADAMRRRSDLGGRWRAVARAVRAWAVEHPHEYALVFGSPVPGYRAPDTTIGPATRVPAVLLAILTDGVHSDALEVPVRPSRRVEAALAPVRQYAPDVPPALLERGIGAWMQLLGAISLELFGHLHNVVEEPEALFEHLMAAQAERLGIR